MHNVALLKRDRKKKKRVNVLNCNKLKCNKDFN